jgi:hypothetical protein
VSSLDEFLHNIRIKRAENSPEILSWRKIFVAVVRKIVLEIRELVNGLDVDILQAEFFIFGDVQLLNILHLQPLKVRVFVLLPCLLKGYP